MNPADAKQTGEPACPAKLNHVTMSVTKGLLEGADRGNLCRFFSAVFGLRENPVLSSPGDALVVGWSDYEPVVFLLANDNPMLAPSQDHFALGVDGLDELDRVLARAETFAATDDRVTVSARSMDDYGVAHLHNIFIRFLIPLLIEVQYLEVLED